MAGRGNCITLSSTPTAKLLIWRKDLVLPSYLALTPFLLVVFGGLMYLMNERLYPSVERIVSKEGFIDLINNQASSPFTTHSTN